jgi:chemotaxis protein MotB
MVAPRRSVGKVILWLAGLSAGCALVPKSQLDECHKLSRSLQAETSQLKDASLNLRAHNQDLAQRAVADGQRIEELEQVNRRLERSIAAYQEEREQMAASLERIKRQIGAVADPLPTALMRRLKGFARDHPGCAFDPGALVLTVPADLLFRAGTDRWASGAETLLGESAALLADPAAPDLGVRVVGHAASSPIRRTGLGGEPQPERSLSGARAVRVRDLLRARAGIDPHRIIAEDPGTARTRTDVPDDGARDGDLRIELHLGRTAPEVSVPAGPDRGDPRVRALTAARNHSHNPIRWES